MSQPDITNTQTTLSAAFPNNPIKNDGIMLLTQDKRITTKETLISNSMDGARPNVTPSSTYYSENGSKVHSQIPDIRVIPPGEITPSTSGESSSAAPVIPSAHSYPNTPAAAQSQYSYRSQQTLSPGNNNEWAGPGYPHSPISPGASLNIPIQRQRKDSFNASQYPSDESGLAYWGSRDRDSWVVRVYGQRREIPQHSLMLYKYESLSGLLQNSLSPLTEQLPASKIDLLVDYQATLFFSTFDPNAHWHVDVDNLPPKIGKILNGVTTSSQQTDIGSRFIRFRFPHVFFEVSGLGPATPSKNIPGHTSSVAIWRAWAKGGANSGLTAYGKMIDDISPEGKIVRRYFEVIQVFQPELFTPVPYPREFPPFSHRNDLLVFSTSWTVIQFLRKSQSIMSFLVALSALLASLQPIVNRRSSVAGSVLAAIGVMSALVSIMAVFIAWTLGWIESRAAQQRQYSRDKDGV